MQTSYRRSQYLRFCAIIGCQPSSDLWDMYIMGYSAGEIRGEINQTELALSAPTAPSTSLTKYIIFCQGLVIAEGGR